MTNLRIGRRFEDLKKDIDLIYIYIYIYIYIGGGSRAQGRQPLIFKSRTHTFHRAVF